MNQLERCIQGLCRGCTWLDGECGGWEDGTDGPKNDKDLKR